MDSVLARFFGYGAAGGAGVGIPYSRSYIIISPVSHVNRVSPFSHVSRVSPFSHVSSQSTVETVGTVGPVGPVALVLLILQFWLTLLAVLVY